MWSEKKTPKEMNINNEILKKGKNPIHFQVLNETEFFGTEWIKYFFKNLTTQNTLIFFKQADQNEEKTELTYNVSYCAIIW